MIALLLALACAPKPAAETPETAVGDWRAEPPAPLPPRPWELPAPATGELSNGLDVVVVENHEVPIVYVRLVFPEGDWTDPDDLPGLASVTMDMLDEGAGEWDAAGLSAELRRLGAHLSTGARIDTATVRASCLRDRLDETLDIVSTVVFEPTFPEDAWEVLREQRLADLADARNDPRRIAHRASSALLYGGRYVGHLDTEAAYRAMTIDDMRAWAAEHLVPDRATFLVGGDITLDEVLPMLEARFGDWAPSGEPAPEPPDASLLPTFDAATIYLVDKPGAAQSVLRVHEFVGKRGDPDEAAFTMANRVIGGQFTARINMNLREDKGWTYGARSYVQHNHLPDLWVASTSVVAEATAPALSEMLAEIRGPLDERPITEAELVAARNGWLGSFPLDFEQPGTLLQYTLIMRLYDLPGDWLSGMPDRVRAVDTDAANAAWAAHIHPDRLQVVVVGDADRVGEDLAGLGLPIVRVDADGQPIAADE